MSPAVKGIEEKIDWVLYDSATLGAADVFVTLFQQPFGQVGKRLPDTNLRSAGSMPGKQNFLVKAVTFHAQPDVTKTLLVALLKDAALDLKIGEKSYLQIPLQRITAGCGVQGLTTGTTIELYHNGPGDPRAVFSLEKPIQIDIQENFSIELSWLTAPGVVKFWVCLEGTLSRAAQ